VFFGKITSINDLINFESSSVAELKKAFKESVENYLKTCKDINKHLKKSK